MALLQPLLAPHLRPSRQVRSLPLLAPRRRPSRLARPRGPFLLCPLLRLDFALLCRLTLRRWLYPKGRVRQLMGLEAREPLGPQRRLPI